MNRVTKILMERDGLTEAEAESLRLEASEALENGDYDAVNDILGLEDDYIFDVLGY